MKGDGHDGVDALIAGVQQRFPDFKFKLIGEPNGYGDHVRFSWGLGPDGICMDAEGAIWCSVMHEGRWGCWRVREGGEVLQRIEYDRAIVICNR